MRTGITVRTAALAFAVLPLMAGVAACSSGEDTAAASTESAASESAASESSASESSASESSAPESSAPESSASESSAPAQMKPDAEGTEVDFLADAILEQLKFSGSSSLSDQLVTIALSPLLRQMASTAGISADLDSRGEKVILVLTGDDMTCKLTVTDSPRARGVSCRAS